MGDNGTSSRVREFFFQLLKMRKGQTYCNLLDDETFKEQRLLECKNYSRSDGWILLDI